MRVNYVFTAMILGLIGSVVVGGSKPVPDEEVKALIANYRERMAARKISVSDTPPKKPPNGTTEPTPWLIPYTKYEGDLLEKPALTGHWGPVRQDLMDNGIRFDAHWIQTIQRNLSGGTNYRNASAGSLDFGFLLDTGKAGLWPGGVLKVRAEVGYGTSSNGDTGAMMPVNMDALFPIPGEDTLLLSELNYTQFFAPWIGVTLGKYSPRDRNVFAHDETEQFMNTAFNFNPVLGTTLPLSALGAGVILRPADWFMVTTMVLDSEGTANRSGFDTVFHRGTTIYQQAELTVKPFGLTGHQRVGWTYSDQTQVQFQQDRRVVLPAVLTGDTSGLKTESSDGAFIYDFDQYLYVVPESDDRGFGIFGRFGVGDRDVNPIQAFYSIGLGGKGMIPGREEDTFGVAYYFLSINDKLPPPMASSLQDEEGFELYYRIPIVPWVYVTQGIQIIDPAQKDVGTTIVLGIRVKVKF
jgi:porin